MSRRTLRLTGDLFTCILAGFRTLGPPRYFRVTRDGLPDDARLVGVTFDMNNNMFSLQVESDSWTGEEFADISPEVQIVEWERVDGVSAN